jgi:hypothetical protein
MNAAAATHRVGDGKEHHDKVSQSMQNEPTRWTLAAKKDVKHRECQEAEQNLDKNIKDFAFEGWFEKAFQAKSDAHPKGREEGHSSKYAHARRNLFARNACSIF